MSWTIYISTIGAVAATLLLLQFLSSATRLQTQIRSWDKLSVVGILPGSSVFSWMLAIAKSVTNLDQYLQEGYDKYSKHGKPFGLPTMWMGSPIVILPRSMLHLLNRRRDELSGFNALLDFIQYPYLLEDRDVWNNPIHFEVTYNLNPKDLVALAPIMMEELDLAFRKCWDEPSVSKNGEITDAYDSMTRITSRVALRVMLGLPLCRNTEYLEQSMHYSNSIMQSAAMINCLPPFMRPVIGRLAGLWTRHNANKVLGFMVPMVQERMRKYEETNGETQGQPDMLHLLIHQAHRRGTKELNADRIARRILALKSMFVFGIGWVFAQTILEIYSNSSHDAIVQTLHRECASVAAQYVGLSTREAVDNLQHVDSAIREAMRLNDVMMHGMPLDVVAGAPLTLAEGYTITPGSRVRMAYPQQMIHLDPDIYPEPRRYDPFRFVRKGLGVGSGEEAQDGVGKTELLATPSTSYLYFGYGRHGCPGRWFVALLVKQAVSYVVLNYDVEVTNMPKKQTLLNYVLPPLEARIQVKRKGEVKS